ncbi:ankyrin repeat domain-containing protein [Melaminivora sp.]|uniref:ankyrin repeat domain-containing protein n=1 Tax=Melaminivora sp. TaxID=1933032 RepID=UPI0028ABBFAC|nr:ankyrin repeat domain-containing protein [Melaminivora sp.]
MIARRTLLSALVLAGPTAACAAGGAHADFFRAIEVDNVQAVSALLRRGFDPNARDTRGQPALVLALHGESPQSAQLLIGARGLKVNARNAKGETALMMAALRGNLEAARALIARDADVNQEGWTPLHYAASCITDEAPEMVALLLRQHAFIDAASPNGTTPLMMAVRYGKFESALLLVREGADPTLKNEKGLSALDFARQADRADMLDLVTQALRRRAPRAGRW